jgi:integration host factor subunit beta
LSDTLARGERIEVRGFGSFSLRYRRPRFGHNPRTTAPLAIPGKHVPHFRPGIELSQRVNGSLADLRGVLHDPAAISDTGRGQ